MKAPRKAVISFTGLVIVLYTAVCLYFYFIQEEILFRPETLPDNFSYNYNFDFKERWFETVDGEKIHAIHAFAPDSSKGLVLFYHGNGGSTRTSPEKFTLFLDLGYDVLYPDYRGYGKSSGELTNEEKLISDMDLVFKSMSIEYNENSIVLLGYSLGTGIATKIAAINNPEKLILWTPYYSMVDMKNSQYPFLPDFLLKFPLKTNEAITEVEEPIFIFYAKNDQILPLERSIKLNNYLDENDQYYILENQGHNRVFYNSELIQLTREILN